MNIKLMLEDCETAMAEMPDKLVDMVITDPPYGKGVTSYSSFSIGRKSKAGKRTKYTSENWDEKPLSLAQFQAIQRISQNQMIFGYNYSADILPKTSSVIVWDKKCKNDWDDSYSDCEIIWTSLAIPARVYRHLWMGACRASETGKGQGKLHPTQKPIAVMRWLVEKFTKPGDTIFDPFMGSGSTGVACVQAGRNFIGCERIPEYFSIAQRRIEEAYQLVAHE